MKHAFDKAGFDRLRFDTEVFCRNFMNSGGTLDLWNGIGAGIANELARSGHTSREDQGRPAASRQPNSEPGGPVVVEVQRVIAPGARNPIPGSGQSGIEAHSMRAADQEPVDGDRGQTPCETLRMTAPSPSPSEGGRGHFQTETHAGRASSPSPQSGGNGQSILATHGRLAVSAGPKTVSGKATELVKPPGRLPSHHGPSLAQRNAMRTVGHHSVPTVFDTFKLPDGRAIGDITFNQLSGLISTNMVLMSIFRQLQVHGVPTDGNMRMRDFVSADHLKDIIATAQRTHAVETAEGVLMQPDGRWSIIKKVG